MAMAPAADTERTFPPADMAAWRRLVERALEGRSFETLVSHTFEGLEISPLNQRASVEGQRAFRQQPGAWNIAQRIDHPDPATANHMARIDLDGGAGALTLTIAGAPPARGFGTAIHTTIDLDVTLCQIDLDRLPLRVDAGGRSLEIADTLRSLARDRRLGSASLDMDIGHDPIGSFARSGTLPSTPEAIGRDGAATSHLLRESGFSGHLFLADGRPYHEAGAGEAQELACVLATGVAYLRLLESAGLRLEDSRDEIAFLLAADADQFPTLAKFRAMRRLWARVESACGLAPKPMRLHAETSFRMMTARDPWANIFRTTIAAFAAAIGGADTITLLPFTLALGLPDEAARRLARNTQLVLIHEAHLAKVADPAAGSGAFETLTEDLCLRAWAQFQQFEEQGGMIASLEAGLPQGLIADVATARLAAIARRRCEITGTSAFPDLAEAPVHVLEPVRNAPAPQAGSAPTRPALGTARDAEPFERLRAASDEMLTRTGSRPRIFIYSFESGAVAVTRVTVARDFFTPAGIEAEIHSGTGTPEEVAAAFSRSGCRIACICASDAVETTARHIDALYAAGAARLYIVSEPPELARGLERRAGTIEIITPGCDVVPVLQNALAQAGAAPFP
jgi:methylmalonyl-CoA mutase